MADIQVVADAADIRVFESVYRSTHWINCLVGYKFYVDLDPVSPNPDDDLWYVKTTDGGETWGTDTQVNTTLNGRSVEIAACWPDWATPGDTGTKIHVAWWHINPGVNQSKRLRYRALDTAGDTLGTDVLITDEAQLAFEFVVGITKARGGNLLIGAVIVGDKPGPPNAHIRQYHFFRSVDGGTTWVARTAATWGAIVVLGGRKAAGSDDVGVGALPMAPGDAADNQDIYLF